MSKHTSGPWFFRDYDYGTFVYCNDGYIISGPVNTRPDGENARLIAAAPELLEALKTMVRAFHTYAPKTEEAEYNCVIEARAVIAKATGEN